MVYEFPAIIGMKTSDDEGKLNYRHMHLTSLATGCIVFHKKVYNKAMRFRGLLEEDNSDRQCGKIKAGFG